MAPGRNTQVSRCRLVDLIKADLSRILLVVWRQSQFVSSAEWKTCLQSSESGSSVVSRLSKKSAPIHQRRFYTGTPFSAGSWGMTHFSAGSWATTHFVCWFHSHDTLLSAFLKKTSTRGKTILLVSHFLSDHPSPNNLFPAGCGFWLTNFLSNGVVFLAPFYAGSWGKAQFLRNILEPTSQHSTHLSTWQPF